MEFKRGEGEGGTITYIYIFIFFPLSCGFVPIHRACVQGWLRGGFAGRGAEPPEAAGASGSHPPRTPPPPLPSPKPQPRTGGNLPPCAGGRPRYRAAPRGPAASSPGSAPAATSPGVGEERHRAYPPPPLHLTRSCPSPLDPPRLRALEKRAGCGGWGLRIHRGVT